MESIQESEGEILSGSKDGTAGGLNFLPLVPYVSRMFVVHSEREVFCIC